MYIEPDRLISTGCFQVIRCCLENSSSVARTFLTSDVVVVDKPESKAPEPAGMQEGAYTM